jgi:hypothetical protein
MNNQPTPRRGLAGPASTTIAGVLLMVVGLTWLAGNLGFLDADELLRQLWPLVLIFLGLGRLLQRRHDHVILGLVLIAAGVYAFAYEQHWLRVEFWKLFGPTVTVLVGGSVIWRAFRRPGPPLPAEPYVQVHSILSGSELRPALPFEGAQLTAVMGGAKLDLTRTPMARDSATIDVFLCMGGAEIIVPPDWEVTVNALCFMGGVADHRRAPMQPPTKHLFISGSVFLGGVELKN